MAFLAPVAGEAAMAAAPELASLAGQAATSVLGGKVSKEVLDKAVPYVEKGASKLLKSKVFHKGLSKGIHKIGNAVFGKHHKTARDLLKKGGKVAGMLASKEAHNVLKTGLDVGKELGMISNKTASSLLDGHKKAMSVHDKLSKFNKIHQQLKPKADKIHTTERPAYVPNISAPIPSEDYNQKRIDREKAIERESKLERARMRPEAPKPPMSSKSMKGPSRPSNKPSERDAERMIKEYRRDRPPPLPPRDRVMTPPRSSKDKKTSEDYARYYGRKNRTEQERELERLREMQRRLSRPRYKTRKYRTRRN